MARRPRAGAAHRHADGSPMKPARSRPVSRCPDFETNANGTFESLARTVRRAFRDFGERVPDDLVIYTTPGVHHAGDEVVLEGMTDALGFLRIPATYGTGVSPEADERCRRVLLAMQRNSIRRAAFRRHLGREPGADDPAWSRLTHPLVLALDIAVGDDGVRRGRAGLDLDTAPRRIALGADRGVVVHQREPEFGTCGILTLRVRVEVGRRLPETLLETIRAHPAMPLAAVLETPVTGLASVDAAVAALAIEHIEEIGGGILAPRLTLHLAPTRFVNDPRIPADVDMGPWLDHLTRHPPIH